MSKLFSLKLGREKEPNLANFIQQMKDPKLCVVDQKEDYKDYK